MLEINKIFTYLNELEENNNREWFHAHKHEKDEAMLQFKMLIQYLIDELAIYDNSLIGLKPSDLIFRLHRDTRFSKNLPPYKPIFAAHISTAGRFPIPAGYFIHIQHNMSFIGGGVFATQFPQAIEQIRNRLVTHTSEFLEIISEKDFKKIFTIKGIKLKNVPKGYDQIHPLSEYLKHKSWDIEYHYSDKELEDTENVLPDMIQKFLLMKDFNDFLNNALVNFKKPTKK